MKRRRDRERLGGRQKVLGWWRQWGAKAQGIKEGFKDRGKMKPALRRANEQSSNRVKRGESAAGWAVIKGHRLRGPAAV